MCLLSLFLFLNPELCSVYTKNRMRHMQCVGFAAIKL